MVTPGPAPDEVVSEERQKEAWVWPLLPPPARPSRAFPDEPVGGRSSDLSDPCFLGRPGGSGLGSAFPAQRCPREERVLLGEPVHPRPPPTAGTGGFVRVTGWTGETSRSGGAAGRRQDTSCVPSCSPACARDSSQALLIPGDCYLMGTRGVHMCVRVRVRAQFPVCVLQLFSCFLSVHCALTSSACPLGQSRGSPSAP